MEGQARTIKRTKVRTPPRCTGQRETRRVARNEAQAHGSETYLCSFERVAALIKHELGLINTSRHYSRILRELSYRPVKPAEKGPEEKQRWLNEEQSSSKKLNDGETILCIDESPYR